MPPTTRSRVPRALLAMSDPFVLPLDASVVALPITAGTPIVIRGSVVSRFDGIELDAASEHWPASAPGGQSVTDPGIIDFRAGGLEITGRDTDKHEVQAVGKPGALAPACARHGTTTPCLVLRTDVLAHQRLLTQQQWLASLRGYLTVELAAPPAVVPAMAAGAAGTALKVLGLSCASLLVAALGLLVTLRARRASQPLRRFAKLVRSVRRAAAKADPVLAQLLAPALQGVARAVRSRRIDPGSAEGQRLASALEQLRAGLLDEADHRRREAERRVVDDLALDVQLALDAAAEAGASG